MEREKLKSKDRVDKVAIRLYDKDWESLTQPQSKYRALAVALNEAEEELEDLRMKFKEMH